jgi:Fe-S cluster biogenesis protein NfuA
MENIITLEKPTLMSRVESALDTIRPYLVADGGNVRIVDITDDMVVQLELLGSCGSCPMSMMTLKAGVEQAIIKEVPEIRAISAVNSLS